MYAILAGTFDDFRLQLPGVKESITAPSVVDIYLLMASFSS